MQIRLKLYLGKNQESLTQVNTGRCLLIFVPYKKKKKKLSVLHSAAKNGLISVLIHCSERENISGARVLEIM